MNEVSARAFLELIDAAHLAGVSQSALLGGSGLQRDAFAAPGKRFAWHEYANLLNRLADILGGPQAMDQIGSRVMSTPSFAELLRFRGLLRNAHEALWFATKWAGPSYFLNVKHSLESLGQRRYRVHLELFPDYPACAPFFHLHAGMFASIPSFLDYTARPLVNSDVTDRSATVEIMIRGRRPWWRRARALTGLLRGNLGLIEDLVTQHTQLQDTFAALVAAQHDNEVRSEHFHLLTTNAQDLIAILNADGTIRYATPSHQRAIGYTPSELEGRTLYELVHPDDVADVRSAAVRAVRTPGAKPSLEFRAQHRDGTWRWFEAFGSSTVDTNGTFTGIITSRDITERKRAEGYTRTLLDLAERLSGKLDRHSLLNTVLSCTAAAVGAKIVLAYLLDLQAGLYRLQAHHGLSPEHAAEIATTTYGLGEPFGGHVAAGTPLICNDVHTQTAIPLAACERYGIAAYVAAPLRARERHYGLLIAFHGPEAGGFDANQIDLLRGLGNQAAVGIEATELYLAQQREAEIASAVARISQEMISRPSLKSALEALCRLTIETLPCDVSHVWLRDAAEDNFVVAAGYGDTQEEYEMLRALRPRRAALGRLIREMEAHGVSSEFWPLRRAPEPFRSALTNYARAVRIPLQHGEVIYGYIAALFHAPTAAASRHEERLARAIGQIASLIVDQFRVREELDRANHLKSEFVATMSHELRTPLNVILGYAELLRDGEFGPPTAEQYAVMERVFARGTELLDLVNATLDLSRLEGGRVGVDLADVDIKHLLSQLADDMRDVQDASPLTFRWEIDDDVPVIRTDPAKLLVVLKNILGNAVKFTSAGSITVQARASVTGVHITIVDTGCGIATDALPFVFDAFRQASDSTESRSGVGLGLYIVQRLLTLIGGEVSVDSVVGVGTTFQVSVPSCSAPAPPSR